jgi:hypothetical protein
MDSPAMTSTFPATRSSASHPRAPSALLESSSQKGSTVQSPGIRLVLLILLYAIPVLITVRPLAIPVLDPDIWWHLRVGEWVAEHGTVPGIDPLSQVNRPWVAYSWLYEVIVYGLYAAFGLAGVVVYRVGMALAVVAAFHWLIRKREPRFLLATALTAVVALAIGMLLGERPWLFTILFTTLTLDVLLDLREGRTTWLTWVLPVLFVIWANVHIQFVYGLILLGLAVLAPVIDALLRRQPEPTSAWDRARQAVDLRVLGLALACFLATFVNPYHVRLYRVIFEYLSQPGPFRFVAELKALEFREPCGWIMLALAGLATFTLGRRKELSSFEVLLLIGTAILAFRARRDLWFLVLASVAILSGGVRHGLIPQIRFPFLARSGAFLASLVVFALFLAWTRDLSPEGLKRRVAQVFPVEASRLVREKGYQGPLFNDFNWGGYLSWSLPHLPVVMDGRTNLHGDERIVRIGGVWAGVSGWQEDPDLGKAGVIVAPARSTLAQLLLSDSRFTRVHQDRVAWVFVARQPGSEN